MSATERDTYSKQQAVSINEQLTASIGIASRAFNTLTAEAAQSPFTTQDLAKGFQAVVASLGQYNINSDQAAKLTVTLGRVSAVAGVSAANMASQFTLFLTGAGRITSPLSRFASSVGLTKQKMAELREEFRKAKDDPEKTAAVLAVLTTRLAAFDIAGLRVAQSWAGIMSNMEESFDLFAGAVTKGLFEKVRNAFIQTIPVLNETGQKMVNVFDESGKLIETKVEGTGEHIKGTIEQVKTKTTGIIAQIFEFDENGKFAHAGGELATLFTAPFKKLIGSLQGLFDIIGTDIAYALEVIVAKVTEWADWAGDNKQTIIDTYINIKQVLISIGNIVVASSKFFGVSEDINTNFENLNTILSKTVDLINQLSNAFSGIDYIKQKAELMQLEAQRKTNNADEYLPSWLGGGDQSKENAQLDKDITTKKRIIAQMEENASNEADRQDRAKDPLKYYQNRVDAAKTKGLSGYKATQSFIPEFFAGKTDTEVMNLIKEADAREKGFVPYQPTATTEKPTNRPGEDGAGGGGGAGAKTRSPRLKSLFADRKALAEAELDIEKTKESNAYDLLKESLSRQADALKQSLEDFEIDYTEYYDQLKVLRGQELASEIQHQDNLQHIAEQNGVFAQDAIKQERIDAQANYDDSEKKAGDLAKLTRELQSLDIKENVEKLKTQRDLLDVEAKRVALMEKQKQILREISIEYRKAVSADRASRREVDSILDGLTGSDTQGERERAQQRVFVSNAELYQKIESGRRSTLGLAGQELEIAEKNNVLVDEYLSKLADIVLIQTERIDTQFALNQLNKEEEKHQNIISELELLKSLGYKGSLAVTKEIVEENRRYAKVLEIQIGLLAEKEALALSKGEIERARELRQTIIETSRQIVILNTVTEEKLFAAVEESRSGLTTFFQDIQADITDVGGAFTRLGQSILGTVQKLLADAAVKKFMGFFLGDEGQTGGTKQGFFASVLRKMGLDPNSKKAEENEKLRKKIEENPVTVGTETKKVLDKLKETATDITAADVKINAANVIVNGNQLGALPKSFKNIKVDEKTGQTSITGNNGVVNPTGNMLGGTGPDGSVGLANQGYTFMPILPTGTTGSGTEGQVELIMVPKGTVNTAYSELSQKLGGLSTPPFAGGDPLAGTTSPSAPVPVTVVENPNSVGSLSGGETLENKAVNTSVEGLAPVLTALQEINLLLQSINQGGINLFQEVTQLALKIDLPISVAVFRIEQAIQKATMEIVSALSSLGGEGDSLTSAISSGGEGLFSGISKFFSNLFGGGTASVIPGGGATVIRRGTGGKISGPGGPKDDKIPAWLSNGEFVIQASAAKALGAKKLWELNNAHKDAPKFANGGLLDLAKKLSGSGKSGGIKGALKGGAISAAISIGLALLGRLFAKKQPKSDPNRVKDPYGLNPDTLTFYKNPIISGARNYLASGGFPTSSRTLMGNMPKFNSGGAVQLDNMDSILSQLQGSKGNDSFNIKQNINITTPDVHSFRNSRAQVERELSRVTQRGLKRKAPNY